jgi:hypothetical protein
MKTKFKIFYLLVALSLFGFGGQAMAQQDSTNVRGVFRANMGRLDLPTTSPAGTQCGWRDGNGDGSASSALRAACQGYDLVGNAAGWNATLYSPEVAPVCYSGYNADVCTGGSPATYAPGFIPYGSTPVDAYGNVLVVGGAGWVAGRAACPTAYSLTVIVTTNSNENTYARTCVAN